MDVGFEAVLEIAIFVIDGIEDLADAVYESALVIVHGEKEEGDVEMNGKVEDGNAEVNVTMDVMRDVMNEEDANVLVSVGVDSE